MKSVIQLPIPPFSAIRVHPGEQVTNKTVLAEIKKRGIHKRIALSKLLRIPNASITKYLKKRMNDKVSVGDILATKRGIFSSLYVKSPVSGRIQEVDASEGALIVVSDDEEETEYICSFVEGRVMRIGKTAVDIEIDGHEFAALKGEGDDVSGYLTVIPKQEAGMFDFPEDVEGSVIVCPSITEESVIKLDVLGAKGCIVVDMVEKSLLPWVAVSRHELDKISRFGGKHSIVRPLMKQVVVCL